MQGVRKFSKAPTPVGFLAEPAADHPECVVCKAFLYLHAVGCSAAPGRYCCAHHAHALCDLPPSKWILHYRFSIHELRRIEQVLNLSPVLSPAAFSSYHKQVHHQQPNVYFALLSAHRHSYSVLRACGRQSTSFQYTIYWGVKPYEAKNVQDVRSRAKEVPKPQGDCSVAKWRPPVLISKDDTPPVNIPAHLLIARSPREPVPVAAEPPLATTAMMMQPIDSSTTNRADTVQSVLRRCVDQVCTYRTLMHPSRPACDESEVLCEILA